MKKELFTFTGTAGNSLSAIIWLPEKTPKLLFQITHGMTEHMGRYERLAEKLTEQGIVTAGFDLPGHGRNPGHPDCASFGETGWTQTLADMQAFSEQLTSRFAGIPLVLMGFSLGSFLVRDYLSSGYTLPSAAVVMGTGTQPSLLLSGIKKLVEREFKKEGFNNTTPLIHKLSFETYNQKFKPAGTDFDWLCSDEQELEAYMSDPLRRANISSGLFWQLLDAMQRTAQPEAYASLPKEFPVLLLSGAADPVGSFGEGVKTVAKIMKKAGMNNVQLKLIAHARHDVFHELQSGAADEMTELLLSFLHPFLIEPRFPAAS